MIKFISRIESAPKVVFLRDFSLSFLILLFLVNPPNIVIALLFLIFLIILNLNLKDLALTSIVCFVLSSILFVGKQYDLPLLYLKGLPYLPEEFPLGYTIFTFIISFADIFATIVLLFFISNFFIKKKTSIKINLPDLLIFAYLIYALIADMFFSRQPTISILGDKTLIEGVVIYFYIRFYLKKMDLFVTLFINLLSIIILFEGFLVLQQFIFRAPLGRSIELIHTFEKYGYAPDEPFFTFRPIGTFPYTNQLALFVSSLLPFIFVLHLMHRRTEDLISFLFGIIILIVTLGRNSWLAFFVSFLYLLNKIEYKLKINLLKVYFKKSVLILILILIPFLSFSIPRIVNSAYILNQGGLTLRLLQFNEAVNLIKTKPLGVGTNMSVEALVQSNNKGIFASIPSPILNTYLLIAMEKGLIGMFILLVVFMLGIKKFSEGNKLLSYAAVTSYIALIIGGFFQYYIDYNLMFLLLALRFDKI